MTGKNSNGSCRSITRGTTGYGKAVYRNTVDKVDVYVGVCPVFGCLTIGLNGGHLYGGLGGGLAVAWPGVGMGAASDRKAGCHSAGNQAFVTGTFVKGKLGSDLTFKIIRIKYVGPAASWNWDDGEDIQDGEGAVGVGGPAGLGGGYVHMWDCEL